MPAVSGSPTQLPTSVTTLDTLAGLPDDACKDGDFAYVQSTRAVYQLDRSSAAAPSAVAVNTFSGNGQWLFFEASTSWETEAAWFIDPANGDDENDGNSLATAIATWAEFIRRVRVVDIGMTVTILGNITEPLRGAFETSSSTSWLKIVGEPTVLAFAAGTTFVDPNPAANARGTLTTTDLTVSLTGLAGDFANYVGKIVRAPAADGYNHWPILLTSAANVAQGPFWAQDLNNAKPVNNTRIEVLDLVTAPTMDIVTNGLGVSAQYLKFTSTVTGDAPALNPLRGEPSRRAGTGGDILHSTFTACEFSTSVQGYQSYFIACIFSASASGVAILPCNNVICMFNGGGSLRPLHVANNGTLIFQGFIVQGAKLTFGATSTSTQTPGSFVSAEACSITAPLGVFDSPTDGIVVTSGANLSVFDLYGSGNTAYGVRVENGATLRIFGPLPTITGAAGTADLIFSGALIAIPPLTGAAVVPPTANLARWTDWRDPPFSRNVVSYSTGAKICGA